MRIRSLLLSAALLCAGAAFAQIDINRATEAELDAIRGIGPATTRRILEQRAQLPFKDWADLVARVRGIGQASAAKFAAQGYTVNGAPDAKADAGAPAPAQQ